MAKATLEFDLNEQDDKTAHLRAVKSLDMASFIFQLVSNEKKSIMHQLDNRDMKDWEVVHLVFDRIHDLLQEHNIDIDELIR
jgi:hypothetical protein